MWNATNPTAGVIATSPTTTPIQSTHCRSLCPSILSQNTQAISTAAAATVVVPEPEQRFPI
jgi:hypothetical protein